MGLAGIMTAACVPATRPDDVPPSYGPVTATFMTDGLLQISAEMGRPDTEEEMRAYTDCAAAEAMTLRDIRFARHVRTLTDVKGGVRRADAIYTVSPARPRGEFVLEAEQTRAACREQGIPGV